MVTCPDFCMLLFLALAHAVLSSLQRHLKRIEDSLSLAPALPTRLRSSAVQHIVRSESICRRWSTWATLRRWQPR